MSIVTKTGDDGTTGLMYGHRVPKNDLRVEACGSLDELNAAIGMARAHVGDSAICEHLLWVQRRMVEVMGEVGVLPKDLERYARQGFVLVGPEMVAYLDHLAKELEAGGIRFDGWATPGANASAAALDLARTVCRRAERRLVALQQSGELQNDGILVFINRLADVLWLLARKTEEPDL